MIYDNCYDWYFWQGVKDATGPVIDEDVDNPPEFHMDNETTQACKEAWQWGFAFGRGLTEKEYLDLITPSEIEKEKREPYFEQSNYPQPVGNC